MEEEWYADRAALRAPCASTPVAGAAAGAGARPVGELGQEVAPAPARQAPRGRRGGAAQPLAGPPAPAAGAGAGRWSTASWRSATARRPTCSACPGPRPSSTSCTATRSSGPPGAACPGRRPRSGRSSAGTAGSPAAPPAAHEPLDLPAPLTSWQLDFKDVSTVPATGGPDGKRQHAVEALNCVDCGTSLLVGAGRARRLHRGDDAGGGGRPAPGARPAGGGHRSTATRASSAPPGRGTSPRRSCASSPAWACGCASTRRGAPTSTRSSSATTAPSSRSACGSTGRRRWSGPARSPPAFREHYNGERPNQARSCGNRPPLEAFPALPPAPAGAGGGRPGRLAAPGGRAPVPAHGAQPGGAVAVEHAALLRRPAPGRPARGRGRRRPPSGRWSSATAAAVVKRLPLRGLLASAAALRALRGPDDPGGPPPRPAAPPVSASPDRSVPRRPRCG